MNKKANSYLVIMIVLLLVVAIITGAGLCYLSWSDEYTYGGGHTQSSEVLDNDQESENVSREEQPDTTESSETVADTTESAAVGTESAESAVSTETAGTEVSEGTENTTDITEAGSEGLRANTITMADIKTNENGEFEYWKDGQLASQKGIDVSKYQGKIDWKKAAADGVEYAFIRVGCRGYGSKGSLMKDETFHQNVKGALAAKVKVGTYFFSQALNVQEAEAEAALVIKELEGYEITYPVAVDIEKVDGQKARQDQLTKAERTEVCIAFCEKIKAAGYIPMVYGDLETFSELLDAELLSEYDFWICETDGDMTFPYEFAVWQYSHEGSVSGIKGDTSISISIKEW